MSEQNDKDVNGITVAGAFAFEAIRNYVNEIRAASSPQTPQQTGGEAYVYFNDVLGKVDAIVEGRESLPSSDKAQVRQLSLNAVKDFVESREAQGITDDHAYARFRAKQDVIEKLLDGQSPRQVLAALQAEDGGASESVPDTTQP